ncbi:Predicted Co/Zn/Cd cation transporters [Mycobacteroides abscessus subsp. abscessus]|nr:Predicted Co/Zn/Cd cation transporters [Mycobacteroides abscessus subsp. abscessus]
MGEAVNAPELDTRARRIIQIVALLNLAGCLGEAILAFAIGSASLLADAADFLEDFLINSLVLLALSWSLSSRRKASYALAGLILIPAGAAFAMAVHKLLTGLPPEPFALSGTALAALVINACCAVLLVSLRTGHSALVRGAWLAARNDVLANVLIIAAGLVTLVWHSVLPDVAVGIVIGLVNLGAAKEVFEQARAEQPELEA